MDDRGEKIVFLARELLREGIPDMPLKKTVSLTVSFKALCLTAILAASSGAFVNHWMSEHDRPLNRYEKTEINALIFYVAKIKGVGEENLRQEVEKQTGVHSLDNMTGSEFPAARRYLQERAL